MVESSYADAQYLPYFAMNNAHSCFCAYYTWHYYTHDISLYLCIISILNFSSKILAKKCALYTTKYSNTLVIKIWIEAPSPHLYTIPLKIYPYVPLKNPRISEKINLKIIKSKALIQRLEN